MFKYPIQYDADCKELTPDILTTLDYTFMHKYYTTNPTFLLTMQRFIRNYKHDDDSYLATPQLTLHKHDDWLLPLLPFLHLCK